ncbi:Uncharacterised protein [Bordetella pertussis]|nr:Uncharacterised protein [Bordetella pertussis]CFO11051.1 Uncharacterised protein [Bordetella pertussis]CFO79619.1 Uncharacterised protein [Bordetella pertussis]CFU89334.1 Uncharacterised protein [Bordetella pertussis]CPI64854.1 Uncharacterised protein [Bordetella pertussis]
MRMQDAVPADVVIAQQMLVREHFLAQLPWQGLRKKASNLLPKCLFL